MSGSSPDCFDCSRTLALASRFLDGRLCADTRRRVQQHLQVCSECMLRYREMRELIQQAGKLPARAASPDLAAAVRESVSQRRQGMLANLGLPGLGRARMGWPRGRTGLLSAAAAALVCIAYGAGYWVGQQDTPAGGPLLVDSGSAGADPDTSAQPSAQLAGFDPHRFERAARGLVHDIEFIDSVPPAGRMPMLAAQLEYFDLDSQAVRVLAEDHAGSLPTDRPAQLTDLARFVHRLAIDLADRSQEPSWDELRQDVRRRGLLQRRAAGDPERQLRRRRDRQDPGRRRAVVDEVAGRLGSADRGSLCKLLELKECFVEGRVEASVRFVGSGAGSKATIGKMFALPVGAVVVRTLSEAGLEDAARTVVMKIATIGSGPGESGTHIRIQTTSGTSSLGEGPEAMRIKQILNQARQRFGGDFEISEPPSRRRDQD